jgi:quinol-cytochrome oxidoreductase complex cytochrome b subunit
MMNETGSYPGQVWLWLYTFWYQIKRFSTSANADVLVMAVMGALSLALVLVPFIPAPERSGPAGRSRGPRGRRSPARAPALWRP